MDTSARGKVAGIRRSATSKLEIMVGIFTTCSKIFTYFGLEMGRCQTLEETAPDMRRSNTLAKQPEADDDDDRCEKVAVSGCGDDSDCIGFTHCSRV